MTQDGPRPEARSHRVSAVVSAGFRGLLAACSMLLLLVVVRTLGELEAGRFYLVFGLVTLGASLGQAGMNHLLSRRVTASMPGGSVLRVWRAGLGIALRGSSVVTVTLLAGAPLAGWIFDDAQLVLPLRILALAVVPLTVLLVVGETWKGLGRPLLSMAAQVGLVPVVAVPLVLLLGRYGTVGAAGAYALAAGGTMLAAVAALHRSLRKTSDTPLAELPPPGHAGATFLYGVLAIVQMRAAPLLLGALRGSEQIVLLEVAMRVLTIPTLLLAGINTMLAPRLARLHHEGRPDALAALCRSVARVALVLIAPLLIAACVFHAPIGHLFGLEGASIGALFAVLAVGEAANLFTGPSTLALLMSGRERAVRNLALFSTSTSVALAAAAIPHWGALGAAAGYAAGILLVNMGSLVVARRVLGHWTAPLARRRPRAAQALEEASRAA